jgi:hypothetical protein
VALEGGHPLERDGVPDVDVGSGDVDPEFDAKRPPARELSLQLPLR